MRLLDVNTLELHEFNSILPPYAILSHTWTESEVAFEELGTPAAAEKQGYEKIIGCCAQAARDGLRYVWIDTCCIDKRSSTELGEAINSMYRWYKKAIVCYAYLADVNTSTYPEYPPSEFANSRWFKRGWTLQELVAPANVVFFRADWVMIGTKAQYRRSISTITGIDAHILTNSKAIFAASIAQRMSWASERLTTRIEDMAYCLLGIFNINMPLLYGEGPKAFLRLQMELLNTTNDHTIFAWSRDKPLFYDLPRASVTEDLDPSDPSPFGKLELLAPSPVQFRYQSDFQLSDEKQLPYHMTNTGLSITLPLIRPQGSLSNVYLAFLNCYRQGSHSERICLCLRHEGNSQFSRLGLAQKSVRIRRDWARATPLFIMRRSSPVEGTATLFQINKVPAPVHTFSLSKVFSISSDGESVHTHCTQAQPLTIRSRAALQFENSAGFTFSVLLGIEAGQPWVNIVKNVDEHILKRLIQPIDQDHPFAHVEMNELSKRYFAYHKTMRVSSSKDATVAIRKVYVDTDAQFHVDIAIKDVWRYCFRINSPVPDEETPLLTDHRPLRQYSFPRFWPLVRSLRLLLHYSWEMFGSALGGPIYMPSVLIVPLAILARKAHWNNSAVFMLNLAATLPLSVLYTYFMAIIPANARQFNGLSRALSRCTLELMVSTFLLKLSRP